MLRSRFSMAGWLAGTGAVVFAACGGSTTFSPAPAGGGSVTGVPPAPGPKKAGDGSDVVLAVSKIYLGDTDRDGTADTKNGWKHYGFNLDGKVSTAASTDLCKPAKGGVAADVYPDGDNGIDNSFGKHFLPLLLDLAPTAGASVNKSIADGKFTLMLDIGKLGAGTAYNPLLTKLYVGGDLGSAPIFDGTDAWPLVREFLNNADATDPKVTFPDSYVINNTWVSGTKAPITVALTVAGYTLSLDIDSAVIAMDLGTDHKSAKNGTIGGVISTEHLAAQLAVIGCPFGITGAEAMSLANQAADILLDGTQDATKTCNGISIGLGFDSAEVQLGPVLPPAPPTPSSCAGGGGGGSGGAGGSSSASSAGGTGGT